MKKKKKGKKRKISSTTQYMMRFFTILGNAKVASDVYMIVWEYKLNRNSELINSATKNPVHAMTDQQ
jgi:hypothetical protein